MVRGAWWATVHGVAKSRTTEGHHFHRAREIQVKLRSKGTIPSYKTKKTPLKQQ